MVLSKKSKRIILYSSTVWIILLLTSDVISVNTIGKEYHSLDSTTSPNNAQLLFSNAINTSSNHVVLNIWAPFSYSSNLTLSNSYSFNPTASQFAVSFTKDNQSVNFPFYDIVFGFSNIAVKIENTSTHKSAKFSPKLLPNRLDNAVGYPFSSSIPYNGYYYYENHYSMLVMHILPSRSIVTNYTGNNIVSVNFTISYASTITGFYLPPTHKDVSLGLGLDIQPQNFSYF